MTQKPATTQTPSGLCHQLSQGSPNIRKAIAITAFYNVASSIAIASVWGNFVKTYTGTNVVVGIVAACSGLSELVAAVVSSSLTDRACPMRKEITLWTAACIGWLNIALTVGGVYGPDLALLYAASVTNGIFYGTFFPALEGILADSVPQMERTSLYSFKASIEALCGVTGFIVVIILFSVVGNVWSIDNMRPVIYCGLAVQLIAATLLLLPRSKDAYFKESATEDDDVDQRPPLLPNPDTPHYGTSGPESSVNGGESPPEPENKRVEQPLLARHDGDDESHWACLALQGKIPERLVPYVVCTSDVIMSLGSGMTVAFFQIGRAHV